MAAPFVGLEHAYGYPTRANLRKTGRKTEKTRADTIGAETTREDQVVLNGTE
jgi:hypothetical protein